MRKKDKYVVSYIFSIFTNCPIDDALKYHLYSILLIQKLGSHVFIIYYTTTILRTWSLDFLVCTFHLERNNTVSCSNPYYTWRFIQSQFDAIFRGKSTLFCCETIAHKQIEDNITWSLFRKKPTIKTRKESAESNTYSCIYFVALWLKIAFK